jgi:hypothetical protein
LETILGVLVSIGEKLVYDKKENRLFEADLNVQIGIIINMFINILSSSYLSIYRQKIR